MVIIYGMQPTSFFFAFVVLYIGCNWYSCNSWISIHFAIRIFLSLSLSLSLLGKHTHTHTNTHAHTHTLTVKFVSHFDQLFFLISLFLSIFSLFLSLVSLSFFSCLLWKTRPVESKQWFLIKLDHTFDAQHLRLSQNCQNILIIEVENWLID
jgi:hypothetical protein